MNEKEEAIRLKLEQARGSLEEANALLAEGAELNFVMNSLYYAFLYPVLGLLRSRGISAPMQSAAISLFDREFVQTGLIEKRFLDALQRAFALRPSCACEGPKTVLKSDAATLLPLAQEFIDAVSKLIG